MNDITDTSIKETWLAVARAREAHGDKDGAAQARRTAKLYEGRGRLSFTRRRSRRNWGGLQR